MRERIATACRVLAARGLADGILGHISVRTGEDEVLVRCRGPRERGLAWTEPADIHAVGLDGVPRDGIGDWSVPNELPLHLEVLRSRPDVTAVAHAHPPAVVAADLAGLAIRPVVGAYDIPGARLAAGGVPVYPRGVLIRTRRLAREMTDSLGDRPVVVLRGHGLTSTGATPEEAVLRAISVDTIARLSLTIASAGGTPADLPAEDLAELPDLGGAFNESVAWRHEVAGLQPEGGGRPGS
ncbi:class II aldolase/adducin family protein [Streptomyces sp. NPDC004609]|uniref:class II aldolase/adducin family protein n=1 Tax=Streptomyces sp. NPDC004609 TaxID=3364704 RepID=UPI0036B6EDBE